MCLQSKFFDENICLGIAYSVNANVCVTRQLTSLTYIRYYTHVYRLNYILHSRKPEPPTAISMRLHKYIGFHNKMMIYYSATAGVYVVFSYEKYHRFVAQLDFLIAHPHAHFSFSYRYICYLEGRPPSYQSRENEAYLYVCLE